MTTTDAGRRGRDARPRAEGEAQRDAERTRLAILAAAEREFSTKGLAGARVDTIAEESGVNKRMIYYYFGSKEDLYVAALERAYVAMRESETALRLDHLAPLDAVLRLVEFKFDYFVENRDLIKLLNGENIHNAEYLRRSTRLREMHVSLNQTIGRILDAGVAEGTIRPGIDPIQLYISISALSYFYFSNISTLSTAFDRDLMKPAALKARRQHAIDVIMGYVRPSPDAGPD